MRIGGLRQKVYDTTNALSLGRLRREVVGWLGLFLLIFNVTAAGALPVQAMPTAEDGHLIICTAGGMAVIDRNGTPVAPDHAGVNGFCGACLPLLHGAVVTPTAVPLPVPFVQPLPRALIADAEPAVVARPLRLAFPRAPPRA